MSITPDLPLTGARFGAFPFDYDHGLNTSTLAVEVGAFLGLVSDELYACRAAGMFHDLGRNIGEKNGGKVSPWHERDKDHSRRSAALAEKAMLVDGNFMALRSTVTERVCRVIAQHDIHGPAPSDPIALALYDADLLEACRLTGGNEGVRVIQERYARLATAWARDPKVQRRWIEARAVKGDGKRWLMDPSLLKITRK